MPDPTLAGDTKPRRTEFDPWPFRLLLAGSVFNQVGFWVQQVGVGWLILELTGSSLQIGIASALRGLPMLVVSPLAGVLVDRLDRRRIVLVSQTVMSLATLLLALLIQSGWVQAWHVFLLTLAMGTAISVNFPARQALIPFTLPPGQVGRGVATVAAGQNGARVVAPGLGGALIALSGLAVCFLAQSLAFLIALGCVWRLPTPPPARSGSASVWDTMCSGFGHIAGSPRLAGLLLLAVVPTVLALPYQQLLPVFAQTVYAVGPGGLGLLLMANSAGAFAGALAATHLMGLRRPALVLLAAGVVLGLSLVLLALAPSFAVGLGTLLLCGGAFAVYNATNNALLHEATTDAYRGRVMSVYLMTWSLYPIATLPAGALADRLGAPLTVALGGGTCALLVLLVWAALPALRELR
ncbi:MAG TPA: MFS transporter [Chloroflexota bacterium]|jgi:MFS family permease|nr:MFS transporter [Chloroflexota bacterium]